MKQEAAMTESRRLLVNKIVFLLHTDFMKFLSVTTAWFQNNL